MLKELDKETILQQMDNGLFAGGVHVFDSVDSTNDWACAELRRGRAPPFVCIADHQSKGRGRRGRHWISPPGANIYLSIAWHFKLPAAELGLLSVAQGVAVIRALTNCGINNAWLKWPNDVLVNNKKIAGILIETSHIQAGSCNVVIGVGLNYRMPENIMPESVIPWTDVAHASSGPLADRNDLVAQLLAEAVTMCNRYQQKTSSILREVEDQLAILQGKTVSLHLDNGDQLTGTVLGINQRGELRVRVQGHERTFSSADVSLKTTDYADS
jgi:BirA family biotin operon repressor/biotin-[acetyl-CoA-carboxylase] ligase